MVSPEIEKVKAQLRALQSKKVLSLKHLDPDWKGWLRLLASPEGQNGKR